MNKTNFQLDGIFNKGAKSRCGMCKYPYRYHQVHPRGKHTKLEKDGVKVNMETSEVFLKRLEQALRLADEYIDIDPKTMDGIPVLKGTRFPISQVLTELANGATIKEIAYDFDQNANQIYNLLHWLALCLNRPVKLKPICGNVTPTKEPLEGEQHE